MKVRGDRVIIQAFEETYDVIYIKREMEQYRVMQCRCMRSGEDYTVFHFRIAQMVRELLPLFYTLEEDTAYDDYKGCFSKDGELYVFFYQREGVPLSGLLVTQSLPLEQRNQMIKRIMEKFLLWRLPDFMICQLLDVSRIMWRDGEVEFDYDWNPAFGKDSGMTEVNQRMEKLLKDVFSEEVGRGSIPGLAGIITRLEQNVPEDFFAVYEAYSSLYDVLEKEAGEYVTGFTKLKNKIAEVMQRGAEVLKVVLFLAAYTVALVLLVKELRSHKEKQEPAPGVIYETIGNLQIK
ncbi:MAG: hypothetical protein K2K56_11165 [Lachnospiraceae bacterium]|nr:hypothetical protein [Lachnospiraceae bacterium]